MREYNTIHLLRAMLLGYAIVFDMKNSNCKLAEFLYWKIVAQCQGKRRPSEYVFSKRVSEMTYFELMDHTR